jgi:hypothetical protein
VQALLTFHPDKVGTHTAAFEVYIRKGRYLLALRAVKKLQALGADAEAHIARVRLYRASMSSNKARVSVLPSD